jgi:2-iminobutanoate/2-iminopropanoate deaminase
MTPLGRKSGSFGLKLLLSIWILCLPSLFGSESGWSQDRSAASLPHTVENRPFSPGLKLGGQVYLSGHLGLDPATGKPPADAGEEAKQVMRSIQITLEQGGMNMDDLVFVEVYCTDLSLYSTFNKEYVSFFHKPYPARDYIGVKELLFGAHFEVMGIAVDHAARDKKQLHKAQ